MSARATAPIGGDAASFPSLYDVLLPCPGAMVMQSCVISKPATRAVDLTNSVIDNSRSPNDFTQGQNTKSTIPSTVYDADESISMRVAAVALYAPNSNECIPVAGGTPAVTHAPTALILRQLL